MIGIGPMDYFKVSYWTDLGFVDLLAKEKNLRTVMAQQGQSQYWKFQCLFADTLNRRNVQVLHGGLATSFQIANGKVSSVTGHFVNGSPFRVSADHFVLAAGGVENIRLLLNGNLEQFPKGVGNNAKGMLGKFFAVHPLISGAAQVNGDKPSFGRIIALPPGERPPYDANVYA